MAQGQPKAFTAAALGMVLICGAIRLAGQRAVATWQYNRRRTGANLQERRLTPANVNPRQFGKLFRLAVDGAVYAQPLYRAGVAIPGRGRHNVLYLATEGDSVYAFDAGGHPRQPLWHDRFINPAEGVTTVTPAQIGCTQITPQIGITATPVIDAQLGTLYVIVRTWERGRFVQRLHALDLRTGAEKADSPVRIEASAPGSGDGQRGGRVWFDPMRNNARAALLDSGGIIYAAWASPCDAIPYHGWILGYDARTLQRKRLLTPSPNSNDGGIWQSGAGLAAGRRGNIYAAIGNGGFDRSPAGADYGDSVIKLGAGGAAMPVLDFFCPFDHHALNLADSDLGSGGPVLLPRRQLVVAGKSGTIYLLNRDALGGISAQDAKIVQAVRGQMGAEFGAPAWWNGNLYFAPAGQRMVQFQMRHGRLRPQPVARTREKFYYPGATPALSANGRRAAIVWALQLGAYARTSQAAVLHAYDARNLGRELYSSAWHPRRDTPGREVKFAPPLVVNGRVYAPTANGVAVYGLFSEWRGRSRPTKSGRRRARR